MGTNLEGYISLTPEALLFASHTFSLIRFEFKIGFIICLEISIQFNSTSFILIVIKVMFNFPSLS